MILYEKNYQTWLESLTGKEMIQARTKEWRNKS